MLKQLKLISASYLFFVLSGSLFSQEAPYICGTKNSEMLLKSGVPAADTMAGDMHVIMFRIAFADAAFEVADEERIKEVNDEVSEFMRANSNGVLNMIFTIYPKIFVYPVAQADVRFNDLSDWIDEQVEAEGLERGTDWDRWIASFPDVSDARWSGLSSGTWSGTNYTNDSYSPGLVAHELGHALGLPHATALEADDNIFGTFNSNDENEERNEYGDPYDVMGGGGIAGHYNTRYKNVIGWLNPVEVVDVQNTGTYRIYSHDQAARSGQALALRIKSGNDDYDYWVEYRTVNSRWTNGREGVTIRIHGYWGSGWSGGATALLDMTPGSSNQGDFYDATLSEGDTLVDHFNAFRLTVTGQNPDVWDENAWIEVYVDLGGTPVVESEALFSPSLLSPWDGYSVRDLNNRLWTKGSVLPRGVYVLTPYATSKPKKLYYQN